MPPPSFALEFESLLPWDGSGALQKKCTCIARAPRSPAPRTRGTQIWMGNSIAEASDRHGGRCSAVRASRRPPPHLPLAALCKSPTCPSSLLLPRPSPNADPPTCPRESLLGRGARPAAARGTQRRRNPRCAHDPRAARTNGLIDVALLVQIHAGVSQTTTNHTRAAAHRSPVPVPRIFTLTHIHTHTHTQLPDTADGMQQNRTPMYRRDSLDRRVRHSPVDGARGFGKLLRQRDLLRQTLRRV
jgi:hypothetical protein